jgi:hypothetical protein
LANFIIEHKHQLDKAQRDQRVKDKETLHMLGGKKDKLEAQRDHLLNLVTELSITKEEQEKAYEDAKAQNTYNIRDFKKIYEEEIEKER